jgi:hypothetical protein
VSRLFDCPIGGPLATCHEMATINVGAASGRLRVRTVSRSSVFACFIARAGGQSGSRCREVRINRTCDRGDGVRSGTPVTRFHHLSSSYMRRGLRTRKGGLHG